MIIKVDHPEYGQFPMPGVVPKLSRTPGEVKFTGTREIGHHNQDIYEGLLNYDADRISYLKEKNII